MTIKDWTRRLAEDYIMLPLPKPDLREWLEPKAPYLDMAQLDKFVEQVADEISVLEAHLQMKGM